MYLLFSGFRGTHRPPAPGAPPIHGLVDSVPDVYNEADFDIPDTQAVLERFMTHMSKLADVEYQALSDLLGSLPDPSSYTPGHHQIHDCFCGEREGCDTGSR
jgi:hypothetical protein